MSDNQRDPLFRVAVLAATPDPQRTAYRAMRQCHSEAFVGDAGTPDETRCGELLVRYLLGGGRGHYGCLEHPQVTFAIGHFPHGVMQQARTHRVGVSFDVQSYRWTSAHILDVADGKADVERVVYLRPAGEYRDRNGKRYHYSPQMREYDRSFAVEAARDYAHKIREAGMSEEHARGLFPFDCRQHFVVSFNARSLMHFFDLRAKADAQLEICQLCDLMLPRAIAWAPGLFEWYRKERWGKARLAP